MHLLQSKLEYHGLLDADNFIDTVPWHFASVQPSVLSNDEAGSYCTRLASSSLRFLTTRQTRQYYHVGWPTQPPEGFLFFLVLESLGILRVLIVPFLESLGILGFLLFHFLHFPGIPRDPQGSYCSFFRIPMVLIGPCLESLGIPRVAIVPFVESPGPRALGTSRARVPRDPKQLGSCPRCVSQLVSVGFFFSCCSSWMAGVGGNSNLGSGITSVSCL